jgi:hypothetical protein
MLHKVRKESIWIKIYVIVLFFFGIGIWVSIQSVHNQKIYTNTGLNRKIESVLVENGIIKNDSLSQYIRKRNKMTDAWNEFYKIIKLKYGR